MTMPEETEATASQRVTVVTGPSGAGRSTAINVLEDLGYEVIDNLPLSLVPRLLKGPPHDAPLALGVDTRTRGFSPDAMLDLIDLLTASEVLDLELMYLDCQKEVLLRRYSETRRRHPLAPDTSPEEGITREMALLGPVRARADLLIDTSDLTQHQLRDEIKRRLHPQATGGLAVTLQSFSFKRGTPRGLDMVFDTRFLRNPHWDPDLRPKDGRDSEVAAYVAQDARYGPFLEQVSKLLNLLVPAFEEEGKSHLSIGIGCTGGRHRSVAITENLAQTLAKSGWPVSIRHRELTRRAASEGPRGSR